MRMKAIRNTHRFSRDTENGTAGHTRQFLPESGYAALTVRVLRNADGTRFFVVRPARASVAAGQYRLSMTYQRDNRAADSASQVLSEKDLGPAGKRQVDPRAHAAIVSDNHIVDHPAFVSEPVIDVHAEAEQHCPAIRV